MTIAETVIGSIRKVLVPIRTEGFPFIGILVFVALFFGWFWQPILWIGLILAALCTYVFRDPPRVTSLDGEIVVSPADGQVTVVSIGVPPAELGLGEQLRRRVSVTVGILDCHVNRAPAEGRIKKIVYTRGNFFAADAEHASERNERNGIVIDTTSGPVALVQIAGAVGRGVGCFMKEGDSLAPGERIGLIRFGARLDLYLPVKAGVLVTEGQTAIAGETVIARFDADNPSAARRVG